MIVYVQQNKIIVFLPFALIINQGRTHSRPMYLRI